MHEKINFVDDGLEEGSNCPENEEAVTEWIDTDVVVRSALSRASAAPALGSTTATPGGSSNSSSTSVNDGGVSAHDSRLIAKDRLTYLLRRFKKTEVTIWPEFLFGTILSSNQETDLINLNPFLSSRDVQCVSAVMVAAILHANRIGQINRCVSDAKDIIDLVNSLSSSLSTLLFSTQTSPASLSESRDAMELDKPSAAASSSSSSSSSSGSSTLLEDSLCSHLHSLLASVLLKGEC